MNYPYFANQMRQCISEFGRGVVYGQAVSIGKLEKYELASLMNLACAYYYGIKP